MTDLETSIKTIADVYNTYASDGGKKRQLDKEELRKLFEEQIKSPEIKSKIKEEDFDAALNEMDKNSDGTINIREFCRFVSGLVKAYYRETYGKGKKGKEGADA